MRFLFFYAVQSKHSHFLIENTRTVYKALVKAVAVGYSR